MKNTWIKSMVLVLVITMGMPAYAYDIPAGQVPVAIMQAFRQKFPQAFHTEWEMDGEWYNVEFKTGVRTEHEIWYDTTGKIVRYVKDISRNELPVVVQKAIRTKFGMCTLDDIERIETREGVTYSMEVDGLLSDTKVIYSSQGKLLQQWED